MDCENIRQTLSAEIDGEAPDRELSAAYRHLADCAECRRWRRDFLQIAKDFPAWADQPIPIEVTSRLQDHIRKTGTAPRRKNRTVYRIPRPLAWAAAAILVLQIGWSSYRLASPEAEPGYGLDAFVPSTIVLTDLDRISTTTIIHNLSRDTDEQ